MKLLNLILFVSVVSAVYFLMHFFLFKRISAGLQLSRHPRLIMLIAFIILGSLFILSKLIFFVGDQPLLTYAAGIWLGLVACGVFFFFFETILSLSFPFYRKSFVMGTVLVVFACGAIAMINGTHKPVIRQYSIPLRNLPAHLSGLSIVQLSDLHLGDIKRLEWFKDVVARTNSLHPDIVVLTGDLIEFDGYSLRGYDEAFRNIESKYGVYAISGNHEFYTGINNFLSFMKKTGIRVLKNESVLIADAVQLIGIDDPEGKRFEGIGPDLEAAMKNVMPSKPRILLSHRPELFKEARKRGIDLQISGHTHAGQIPPMDLIVNLYFKHPYGLYEEDGTYIYTSCGTGVWGTPMRLLFPSEIVKLILVSDSHEEHNQEGN